MSENYDRSPLIYDPLYYHNVSKSSFKIYEVVSLFSETLDQLNETKLKYDKFDSSLNTTNIIYDLLLLSKKK